MKNEECKLSASAGKHWSSLFVFRFCLIACRACLSTVVGCATWESPADRWDLPKSRIASNQVVLEVAFVRAALDASTVGDDLWHALDEQFLRPEMRRQLAANGLRAGLVSGQLPDALRRELDKNHDPLAVLNDARATQGSQALARRERRQCQDGVREEIEVLPDAESACVLLLHENDRVRAERFEQPRGVIWLTARLLGDGRVRSEIVPVIESGESRNHVIGGQAGYRIDSRREQRILESLRFDATLAPGQTLVLAPTPEAKGLGGAFFAGRFDSQSDGLLMLIRLAQSDADELFAPTANAEPLFTPLE